MEPKITPLDIDIHAIQEEGQDGANAVVIRDVPDNCIDGGVPAKILKSNQPTP